MKNQLSQEERDFLEIYIDRYSWVTEFLFIRHANEDEQFEVELGLDSRDSIQDALEKVPEVFTEEQIRKIDQTDRTIIKNARDLPFWYYMHPDRNKQPKSRWWWHLDLVEGGEVVAEPVSQVLKKLG